MVHLEAQVLQGAQLAHLHQDIQQGLLHSVLEFVVHLAACHAVEGARAARSQTLRHFLHLHEAVSHEASQNRPEVPLRQKRELSDFFLF